MVNLGVISPVKQSTDWCSGMVVVPKPDGSVRVCVDLTHLNSAVKREVHPMSSVDESLAKLGHSKLFTQLDANSGFWQLPLDKSSRLLTTFLTPEGRFCFNRLPFGISSAPEIYQRCMSNLLAGLDGVICHMDNLLIHGRTTQEHDGRVKAVLKRISDAGLTLNKNKCSFATTSIKFLGHIIDESGIHADPKKTAAIINFPTPQHKSDLRRLNGLLNQLAKFLPHLSTATAPIRELLKEHREWTWGPPQSQALQDIKYLLTSPQVLAPYDPSLPTIIASDASQHGLGAALFEIQADDTRRPICFASRSLSDTEKRYAVIEKEALGAVWACEKLEQYIYGIHDLTLEVDHKPLVPLFTTTDLDKIPPRVLRFRLRLMKYSPTVKYVPGAHHLIADTLSRATYSHTDDSDRLLTDEVESYIDNTLPTHNYLYKIKKAQQSDPVCCKVAEFSRSSWPAYKSNHPSLTPFFEHQGHLTLADDILLYDDRLVIPSGLQLEMLQLIHEGHLGITKCRARARRDVWWPGMSLEISTMINNCLECKKQLPTPVETLAPSSLPDRPWQRLAMDLFELNGHTYLIVDDYFSRWIEVTEMKDLTSKATISALTKIFSTHGYPDVVVSDNGPQFAVHDFSTFATDCQFIHVTSSPRYPKANGEAERAVGTIKRLLKKSKDLNSVLLNYRVTPLDNGYSPAELLMGRRLKSKIPCLSQHLMPILPDYDHIANKEQTRQEANRRTHDQRHRAQDLPELNPGDNVYLPDQDTLGVIETQVAPRSYTVSTENQSYRRNRSAIIKTEPATDADVEVPTADDPQNNPTTSQKSPRPMRDRKPPPFITQNYV